MNYIGTLLDPQPEGRWQGRYLDCIESADGITFTFHEGNEMEGHTQAFGPITAPASGLVPKLDWSKAASGDSAWRWEKRTKPTYNEWLHAQPWYKKDK